MKYKIALLQLNPIGSNQNENMKKGLDFCRKAKSMGADMVVFPEMWNTGFESLSQDITSEELSKKAINRESDFFTAFKDLSLELNLNIVLTYLEKTEGKPKNSAAIIDRSGKVVLNYSKVFCCQFGAEELKMDNPDWNKVGCDLFAEPGKKFPVCEVDGIKFGAMICADRESPEAANMLVKNGVEIIVVPNACHIDSIRACLLRARSFEILGGIAMANYSSPRNNGHSSAYDCVAWDEKGNERDTLLAQGNEEEKIVMAEFDIDLIRKFREEEDWRLQYKLKFNQ